jgi:hypothetical protein
MRRRHGYGLWVARQLADLITTYTGHIGTITALDFPHTTDR